MKKNIAILMGGYSSEYQISIDSGNVVYNSLNRDIYHPFKIVILKDKWIYLSEDNQEYTVNKNDFSVLINENKITFDCAFNAIHGTPGEDGYLQAYLELLNIPHTSCTMYQAAITFNKRDCLSILKAHGIKTAISYYLNFGDSINEKKVLDRVGLPCFVKPNKSGSSFGISKVYKEEELGHAIAVAFKEDNEIIIESFLKGTEVSVGVITFKGGIKVLPITEIVSDNDFFDFEAKYSGECQEITPARLTKNENINTIKIAKQVYTILKLKGFSRSEFILIDEQPHLLEINTVPGLTKESILPQQAIAAGMTLEELFNNAIEEALK